MICYACEALTQAMLCLREELVAVLEHSAVLYAIMPASCWGGGGGNMEVASVARSSYRRVGCFRYRLLEVAKHSCGKAMARAVGIDHLKTVREAADSPWSKMRTAEMWHCISHWGF